MRGIGAVAASAIEAELFDLYAQGQGKPLCRVLGGGKGRKILAYASAGDLSFSPDGIFQQAKRLRREGFRAYKIRAGGRGSDPPVDRLQLDVDRIAAGREAMSPDASIFVDVGVPQRPQPWPRSKAEAYLRAFEPYKIGFLEEPAMTYDVVGYAALQKLGLAPIAGGESFADPEEFSPFFEAGAYGVAQPDAAVVGGPASCTEVCRMAGRYGVPVCLHAWSAGVGIAQNLHVAWAADNAIAIEFPVSTHAPQSEPLAPLLRFDDGYLMPSLRPGLGVEITEQLLARYRYQAGNERDF
jgi:L-alanine-DL-glutamate epimerase-like enolase superfamily enzyme